MRMEYTNNTGCGGAYALANSGIFFVLYIILFILFNLDVSPSETGQNDNTGHLATSQLLA